MQHFEDLRKELKRLEQEIDQKLSSYSNLGERIEQWSNEEEFSSIRIVMDDVTSQTDESAKEVPSPLTLLDELQILLEKLKSIHQQLNDTNMSGSILGHHRSKLEDYTREFKRLKENASEAWERRQLLRGGRKREAFQDRSPNMDSLVRERGSIHNSSILVNDLISQAQLSKEQLDMQTKTLLNSNSKLRGIGRQLPSINSIMNQIRNRKYKNNIILGVIAGICMCFLLWWWISTF